MQVRRLLHGDRETARSLFTLMAEVFSEESEHLTDAYLDRLLRQDGFWAIAAFAGEEIVGGVTAHTLPMTKIESSEIFIYDIAVRHDHQRKGVGRKLVTALREAALAVGVQVVFVPADNDDVDALDFYRALGGKPSSVLRVTLADGRLSGLVDGHHGA